MEELGDLVGIDDLDTIEYLALRKKIETDPCVCVWYVQRVLKGYEGILHENRYCNGYGHKGDNGAVCKDYLPQGSHWELPTQERS
jgi:hypothetical protein